MKNIKLYLWLQDKYLLYSQQKTALIETEIIKSSKKIDVQVTVHRDIFL